MSEQRSTIIQRSIYDIKYINKDEAFSAIYRLFASPKCPFMSIDITFNAKRNGKTEHYKSEKGIGKNNPEDLAWEELKEMDPNIFEISCLCYPYTENVEPLMDNAIRISYFNIQTSNMEITIDTTKCDKYEHFKDMVLDILR